MGQEVPSDQFGRGVWEATRRRDASPESYTGAPDPVDPANVYAEGKRTAELLAPFIRRLAASSAKLRAAGLSVVRIFPSTSTLPSATSSGTFLQAGNSD